MSTNEKLAPIGLSGSKLVRAQSILKEMGLSLDDAMALAEQKRNATQPKGAILQTMLNRFIEARLRANIRGTSSRWFATRMAPLYERYGSRQIGSLTRADLRDVLRGMNVTDATRNNYARAWRAFWRWSMAQEEAAPKTDITLGLAVPLQKSEREGAEILGVADCERIMAGVAPEYRSATAILLFAGVRPQEIWGIDKPPLRWAHVNVAEKIIRIPADIAKTRKGRVIEGLPDTIWRFIKPLEAEKEICPCRSQQLIRHIQQVAGFYKRGYGRNGRRERLREWPHDGTRHSFATYALALTADAAKVALWLGHESSVTMLHRHYRGLTTKPEAERFFGITPASAASPTAPAPQPAQS